MYIICYIYNMYVYFIYIIFYVIYICMQPEFQHVQLSSSMSMAKVSSLIPGRFQSASWPELLGRVVVRTQCQGDVVDIL